MPSSPPLPPLLLLDSLLASPKTTPKSLTPHTMTSDEDFAAQNARQTTEYQVTYESHYKTNKLYTNTVYWQKQFGGHNTKLNELLENQLQLAIRYAQKKGDLACFLLSIQATIEITRGIKQRDGYYSYSTY
jgi:hypothetical protein